MLCRRRRALRLSLLAAGDLAGYAAVYLKNDGCTRLRRQIYAKFCRGELLLSHDFSRSQRQIYAKFYGQTAAARCADRQNSLIRYPAKFYGKAAERVLTACVRKKISMAYVRRESLATSIPASPLIKFANFISRACADYADEAYKSACDMQTLGFILPPSQRLKFYLLTLRTPSSRPVFTLAQSIAQL